jgi:RNA polymerase sigma factor (sigma-70 family)
MSKITIALEAAVATVLENTAKEGERQTARQRANVDRAFATILKLITPRIRHFIRQYGLTAHWDDAEQCCAIGVHRAIQTYDPTRAQFTTLVNWQLRGELQSLRFRLMTDQRASAKKVDAKTVSLHASTSGPDGEEASLEAMIEDENALESTESGASDYLAKRAAAALIDEYVTHNHSLGMEKLRKRPQPKRSLRQHAGEQPALRSALNRIDPAEVEKLDEKLARDREILERRVFGEATLDDVGIETGITKEQIRQICKRATKGLAGLASTHSRFAIMADYGITATISRRSTPTAPPVAVPVQIMAETAVGILPDPSHPHNRVLSVVAIDWQDGTARGATERLPEAGVMARSRPAKAFTQDWSAGRGSLAA